MTAPKVERQEAVRLIGAAIRSLREQKSLTLERLAMSAGISYQYLSGIETGKENFSIAILDKIVRALDTPMVTLIALAYANVAPDTRPAPGGSSPR